MLKFSQIKALIGLHSFSEAEVKYAIAPTMLWTEYTYLYIPTVEGDILAVLNRFHKIYEDKGNFVCCTDCKAFEQAGFGIEADGDQKCSECADSYFCSEYSGDYFHNNDRQTVETSNGSLLWSEKEAENHGWQCPDCGNHFCDRVSGNSVNGTMVCDECYEGNYGSCGDCGEGTRVDNLTDSNRHENTCESCISQNYHWSDSQDIYVHEDDEHEDGILHPYSTRVEDEKEWGTPISTYKGKYLYMGIELEVEVSSSGELDICVDQVMDATDEGVICCEDGSLTNGFEIKTPPMNLSETKAIFEAVLSINSLKHLKSHDGGNCGLHINLSRDGLTQLQQAKIYYFYNTGENARFLKAICRRYTEDNQYAKVDQMPKLSVITNAWRRDPAQPHKPHTCYCKGKVIRNKGSVLDARYVAVNFTGEKLEIRLPRGTLKRNTLMANLELAAALTEFTRTGERFAQSGKYAAEFFQWLQDRPCSLKDFPELVEFCVHRKFLPESMRFKSSVAFQARKEELATSLTKVSEELATSLTKVSEELATSLTQISNTFEEATRFADSYILAA